jgi:hypothetical protein
MRQRWSFSSPDAIREVEEYRVELSDVTALELVMCLASVGERLAPRSRVCVCLNRHLYTGNRALLCEPPPTAL